MQHVYIRRKSSGERSLVGKSKTIRDIQDVIDRYVMDWWFNSGNDRDRYALLNAAYEMQKLVGDFEWERLDTRTNHRYVWTWYPTLGYTWRPREN